MKLQVRMSLLSILCLLVLAGCSRPEEQKAQTVSGTGFVAAVAGNYDSADTAVVVSKNQDEHTITFRNLMVGRQYTLSYDGATTYADKYGQALSLEQIGRGELVDVTFMKSRKRLNSMQLTPGTFRYENMSDLAFNGNKILLGKEEYTLGRNMAVLTGSGLGEVMDLASVDRLVVLGVDHTVYSIVATTGHGYLRLANESYFVGGWVEVGQSLIFPIEDDMLLTVPAGAYDVTVSGSGSSGTEHVVIRENEETVLDVSKWQGEEKFGTLVFSVHPDETRIYIDGSSIEVSEPQELSYGIHQMIAIADGYETISKYIKVSAEYASMDVSLERKNGEKDGETSSGDTVSQNTASENSASGNSASGNAAGGNTASGNQVSGNNVSANTASENKTDADKKENAADQGGGNTGGAEKDREKELGAPVTNEVVAGSDKYRVHIDGPAGVEVYVDGSYVGIAPISFAKKIGSHDITLRKAGYQTRTYTISADDSEKDVNYSFSELVPIN